MKYTTLLALFGLAAAAPRGQKLVQRPAGQHVPNRSRFIQRPNSTEVQYSSNWSGAVQIGTGFKSVTGTITVPRATGGGDAASSAWVGIDGDTCQTAILQTGLSFYGDGSFDAWFEWIPDYSHSFSGFDLSVGDQVKITVTASSKTAGVATLENLTSGQTVHHTFTSPPSTLCETNAEWIVEDFEQGGSLVPFANFGSITFTDASAQGSAGTVTPQGGTIIDLRDPDTQQVLSTCSTSGAELTCKYTGDN